MSQAIEAYREVVVSSELKEIERLRAKARHDEAWSLEYARSKEREKLQGVLADKDAALADKDAALADKDAALADKDAELADKDAEIARLRALLDANK